MGGKGGESGGSQQSEASFQDQARAQAQADFAAGQKQAAASKPAEAPKTEEPVKTDITKDMATTDTTVGKDNLTGLGDELVAGLSPGRIQQVSDQTSRVTAQPQGYTPYDPYSGAFVGQGPYNKTDATKQGQV